MQNSSKYMLVENDYDNIDITFHNSYNSTAEFASQLTSFTSQLPKNATVLNVGGTLPECQYFINRGCSVTNIDISKAMLDYIAKHDPNITLVRQNIRDYHHKPFNAVWACRSLIHIPPDEIASVLSNIKSLLISGGLAGLIFFTSKDAGPEEQYQDEIHTNRSDIVYYRVLYSTATILSLVRSAGFEVRKLEECLDADREQLVYIELTT
jgi:cyclopropane fatty-acyl-phospholipid synthase-like methyltransferase